VWSTNPQSLNITEYQIIYCGIPFVRKQKHNGPLSGTFSGVMIHDVWDAELNNFLFLILLLFISSLPPSNQESNL
jgi:hypothetical protein